VDKYKKIIDDWEKFKEYSEEHQQPAIRKNSLKAGEDFEKKLGNDFEYEHADWNSNIYRLNTKNPGKSMLQWRGDFYVQEESAALPVKVLDPQPGEEILDMCAAPGGKTTQIAARTNNSADIIANDDSKHRIQTLQMNIYRTGSVVTVTNYDGCHLPEDRKYDRILLDAPCTGEGDRYRKNFEAADEGEKQELAQLQKELIEKAAKLLKEGGTLIYSTCTINTAENESVVQHAVENTSLETENIETDIKHVRGVEQFEDKEYSPQMKDTVRVYPHHFNSGVIYVAKFTK